MPSSWIYLERKYWLAFGKISGMEQLYTRRNRSGSFLWFRIWQHRKCSGYLVQKLAERGIKNIKVYDVSVTNIPTL